MIVHTLEWQLKRRLIFLGFLAFISALIIVVSVNLALYFHSVMESKRRADFYLQRESQGIASEVLIYKVHSIKLDDALGRIGSQFHINAKIGISDENGVCIFGLCNEPRSSLFSRATSISMPLVSGEETLGTVFLSFPWPVFNFGYILASVLGGFLVFLVFFVSIMETISKYFEAYVLNNIQAMRFAFTSLRNGNLDISLDESKTNAKEFSELAILFNSTAIALKEMKQRIEKFTKNQAQAEMAQQVAHDIRSPLAALEMVMSEATSFPEDLRVLARASFSRMKYIANGLLTSTRKSYLTDQDSSKSERAEGQNLIEEREVILLSSIIDTVVSEKKFQYRSQLGIDVEFTVSEKSYGHFALVQLEEFKRLISNLVNNAIEAIGSCGKVVITVAERDSGIEIKMVDNGKGIPSKIISKLGQRGVTFAKGGGSGLGLYHARTAIESWGGTLSIESGESAGTTVAISLPKSEAPLWFLPHLDLEMVSIVVVLDDDQSIHEIWHRRLVAGYSESSDVELKLKLVHLVDESSIRTWLQESDPSLHKHTLYLCDYELMGKGTSGLDLIEELGLTESSVLVTSYYEDKNIRGRCEKLGVKLIPKGLAGFVPIKRSFGGFSFMRPKKLDGILIDDDPIVRMLWQMKAKITGKSFEVFSSAAEFWEKAGEYSNDTPIYVDVELEDGVRGQDLSREISSKGFTSVFLATAHVKETIGNLPWVKDVIGKDPPF